MLALVPWKHHGGPAICLRDSGLHVGFVWGDQNGQRLLLEPSKRDLAPWWSMAAVSSGFWGSSVPAQRLGSCHSWDKPPSSGTSLPPPHKDLLPSLEILSQLWAQPLWPASLALAGLWLPSTPQRMLGEGCEMWVSLSSSGHRPERDKRHGGVPHTLRSQAGGFLTPGEPGWSNWGSHTP